jgi:hypothetical protein
VKIREKKENYKQKVKESFDIDEAWALADVNLTSFMPALMNTKCMELFVKG